MSWQYYNPNPATQRSNAGDCVIRAISKVFNCSWERAYAELTVQGFKMGDWGNANDVWDAYLRQCGFQRKVIPNTCPDCYTVKDFCYDYNIGQYILATGSHVVAVINGDYYDSWDSGNEVPIYFYERI